MFSASVAVVLHIALREAVSRHHAYLTLEHLLYVLSHDPDMFPEVPPWVALTLAGHTHGGQVAIPLLRRPMLPSQFGERYARGHIQEDGKHMVVSSGVGTSGLPIRLFAPPEVLVLTLRASATP